MIVLRSFSDLVEANIFLQGGIIGGKSLRSAVSPADSPGVNEGLYRLHATTLIFSSPAAETVTFAATPATVQVPMTVQEVKTQIEAQTTGVLVRFTRNGRLILIESTPSSSGVAITDAGTGNEILGFGNQASIGVFINSDGATSPFFLSLDHSTFSNALILVTEE